MPLTLPLTLLALALALGVFLVVLKSRGTGWALLAGALTFVSLAVLIVAALSFVISPM